MNYDFTCETCETEVELDIPISKYDELKDKQKCPFCKGQLKRKIIWSGGVTLCSGMYGIDGKKGWTN